MLRKAREVGKGGPGEDGNDASRRRSCRPAKTTCNDQEEKKKRRRGEKKEGKASTVPSGGGPPWGRLLAGFVDDVGRFGCRGMMESRPNPVNAAFVYVYVCVWSWPILTFAFFFLRAEKGRGIGNGSCLSCNWNSNERFTKGGQR
ncbi:hypothetical protein CGRA01v4_07497 [Colletotrichum graminicola]|nr:hypothetical protein CGRA01v4_07497 [Colletotrichum graminicola]